MLEVYLSEIEKLAMTAQFIISDSRLVVPLTLQIFVRCVVCGAWVLDEDHLTGRSDMMTHKCMVLTT